MSTNKKVLTILGMLLLLAGVGAGSYYVGQSHRAAEVETLKADRQAAEQSYAISLERVNDERKRALNDYEAACTEYKLLYVAYEQLYEQHSSGMERYSSPDGARGNEESCYR